MKFFAFVLSLQTLSSHYCSGFSYSASSSQRAVAGLSNPSTSLKSVNINEQEEYANAMSIRIASSTTLALGLWAMSASPSLASHPMNPAAASSQSSSSFVVAADYSSSDFADFSLPSYKDALTSPINANLKGDKQLLGEEESSASSSSTSSPDATPDAPAAAASAPKEPTAAELKAEKAAAKAAQKAAREAQQAAVEAAIAAKK